MGYGRTGKQVAEYLYGKKDVDLQFVVRKSNIKSKEKYSIYNCSKLSKVLKKYKPEVIIDFSTKVATLSNLVVLVDEGFSGSVVLATTGFDRDELEIIKQCSTGMKICWAPNITDGVNAMMFAARKINDLWPDADVHIIEEHFKDKKGVSGTAIKIQEILGKGEIVSIRSGGTVGIHSIIFGNNTQKITLTHQSHSRNAFASGALNIAAWLLNQPNGFYTVKDFVEK